MLPSSKLSITSDAAGCARAAASTTATRTGELRIAFLPLMGASGKRGTYGNEAVPSQARHRSKSYAWALRAGRVNDERR
jgi:hypothetical protein